MSQKKVTCSIKVAHKAGDSKQNSNKINRQEQNCVTSAIELEASAADVEATAAEMESAEAELSYAEAETTDAKNQNPKRTQVVSQVNLVEVRSFL